MLVNILMYWSFLLPHTISDELQSNVIHWQTEWPISAHTNGRQNIITFHFLIALNHSIYLTIFASRCDLETDTTCSELPWAPPLPVNQSWMWCWCLVSLKSYEDDHSVNHLNLSEKKNFSAPTLKIKDFLVPVICKKEVFKRQDGI